MVSGRYDREIMVEQALAAIETKAAGIKKEQRIKSPLLFLFQGHLHGPET